MLHRVVLIIKNVSLLLLSYSYFLVRGSAKQTSPSPKKIIVVAASKLGDMVCVTPIFRAIKQTYPDCAVVVFGTKPYKLLHRHNPDIDTYVVRGEKESFWGMVKKIHNEHADVALVTGPNFLTVVQFFFAGVGLIVGPKVEGGFCPYQTKPYRFTWPLIVTKSHDMQKYAPREYLRLLEAIGITAEDTTKHLYLSAKEKLFAKQFYQQIAFNTDSDFIVGVVPGAGNEIKQWSPKKFAETIKYLREKYNAKILVLGSGKDKDDIDEVFKNLPTSGDIVNGFDMFSLEQLKAVVAKIHLCVAVDTGIIYIAEAFGVPTIDIVGPVDENVQPPRGDLNRIVCVPHRIPQLRIMNARTYDFAEAKRQIDKITTEMVLKEIDAVISKIKSINI